MIFVAQPMVFVALPMFSWAQPMAFVGQFYLPVREARVVSHDPGCSGDDGKGRKHGGLLAGGEGR